MSSEMPPWPGLKSRMYGHDEESASELWWGLMVAGSVLVLGLGALMWGWAWVSR
jgi:hypothetical protein